MTLKTSHSKGKSNQPINIITKDEKHNKTCLYNVEVYQRNGIIRCVTMLNKSTKDEQEFAGRIREKRLLPVVQTAARVLEAAHIRLVGSEQLTS